MPWPSLPAGFDKKVKYIIVLGLTVFVDMATWWAGDPGVTLTVSIGSGILLAKMVIQDLEKKDFVVLNVPPAPPTS